MKNIKTTWNLGLLYKNEKDPQIEKDLKMIERVCMDFEKKYKKADFTSSAEKLLKALEDREELRKKINGSKPWWYFTLKNNLNADDIFAQSHSTQYSQRLTGAFNKLTFFSIRIAQIVKTDQKKFLMDPILQTYKYSLKRSFEAAKYKLSEGEEQIIDLLSETSYTMWKSGQNKLLSSQVVVYEGKEIPITKAVALYPELPKKERRELYLKISSVLQSIAHFAEAEINAVYNYKKVLDERRGYNKPYSATVIGNENNEKSIELLVDLVTKHFSISQRYYKVHAKLLREKKILSADRNARIGDIHKKFDFLSATTIVRSALGNVDVKYAKIFDSFLENGQIDVYPRKGKRGGAFCWKEGLLPTFVFLNHSDDINSVETLGHEMGHAIHWELSQQTQPPRYRDFSTATAEVASTFFEQVTMSEIEKHLSEDEKIIFLHTKIKSDIMTIFQQVAGFNFELQLHEKIRKEGFVSKENIASLLSKNFRASTGNVMDIQDEDGYFFVRWSHIRNFFYVYTYAYGQLISRALFENWKKDPGYAKKIEQFLSAGRSMSPEDIFKSIGIDTSDPAFFEAGLKGIESDIKRLEIMAKKAGY